MCPLKNTSQKLQGSPQRFAIGQAQGGRKRKRWGAPYSKRRERDQREQEPTLLPEGWAQTENLSSVD